MNIVYYTILLVLNIFSSAVLIAAGQYLMVIIPMLSAGLVIIGLIGSLRQVRK